MNVHLEYLAGLLKLWNAVDIAKASIEIVCLHFLLLLCSLGFERSH